MATSKSPTPDRTINFSQLRVISEVRIPARPLNLQLFRSVIRFKNLCALRMTSLARDELGIGEPESTGAPPMIVLRDNSLTTISGRYRTRFPFPHVG